MVTSTNGATSIGAFSPRAGSPSLSDVLDLIKAYQEYYNGFHNQCREEEGYYYLERKVPVPTGIDPIIPSKATALVNVATDHVDVSNIEIDVPIASPRATARAERIKKALIGSWQSVKRPVLRTSVRHAFLYGIAFRKTMFASELWPDAPQRDDYGTEIGYKDAMEAFMEKRAISFPFVRSNVNPKNFLWDDAKRGMEWAIEYYQRDAREIFRRYPDFVPSGQQFASWAEYWDKEWCMYVADSQIVWGPYRHHYGGLPYTLVIPNNALDWDDGAPQMRYQGLLKPVHNLLDTRARLMSQYEALVRTTAWRTLDFTGPPDLTKQTMDKYELFGGKNQLLPGVTVALSPLAQVPQEILQEVSMIDTEVEEATFPSVVRGLRPRGVGAGYAIGILAGMGRLVFQGVADGLARSIEEDNQVFLKLIENKVQGRITVHARTDVHSFDQSIGPDDIQGYYENTVRVRAEAPEERERQTILAIQAYQGLPGFSGYEALKRAGVPNPLQMMNQRAAEDVLLALRPQAALLLQQRLGLNFQQQLAEAAEPVGKGEEAGIGNRNQGEAQLGRPGEGMMQQARVASRTGQPSAYPQGLSGLELLGRQLGMPGGGSVRTPSGRRVGA